MNDRAATLDRPDDNGEATAGPIPFGTVPRGGSMKFTYASGSKPLEGYTIKRGVGIGGFGEVYFAVTDAGKEVALKRVQRNLDVEIRGVSQCLNLKHPNLVDLYDIRYDDQGGAWVVMEFITGESLKDVIDRNPNGLPREDVAHWFLGICEGVGYLHDHGIVHRDLKPGNIFSDQGEIKIGDYGLSKFIAASRRSGQTESVGTFHYMAPEIGKGSYGKEIDIYALGIILYEMLTGKVPFDGESSQEIIMRHLTEDADVSSLPPPYRNVVARAMTKDPELRYTRVSQMVDELGSVLRPGSKTVVTATVVPPAQVDKVLYIGDEPPPREMVFGPLRQRSPSIPQVALHPVRRPLPGPAPLRQPVSQTVAQTAEKAASWWQGSILNTGLKASIVVVLIAIAVMNPWLLVPLAFAAVLLYAIYGGIWLIGKTLNATPQPVSGTRLRTWQEMVRENLRAKTAATRLGELTGGLVAAAILCGLISVALIAGIDQFDPDVTTLSLYAWLAISSTLGAWAVLTVGKFCEGIESDAWRRRAVLLALGLALGAAAWGLGDRVLLVDLQTASHTWQNVDSHLPGADAGLLARSLVFFAALFAVPGWWKQTDPLRRSRVNLFTLGWCVLWSGMVSLLWPFPQPWGLMLAATVSLSTQLAAPWMTTKEREAAKKEFRRA